jgi:uncharacterized protein YdeI (YjbR/CyaY-like superfamily)
MPKSLKKSFTALLEPDGTALKWVIARVPFKVGDAWPTRRGRRVRGEIEGFAFRTSLFPDRTGQGQILLVNKKMQKGAHARIGEKVRITLEPDLEERAAVMPPELAKALKGAPGLRNWFDGLTEYTRRIFCALVDNVKGPEARVRMADRVAEQMLQAWEGENDTPPILKAAFIRQPLAEAGWQAMTPIQRRGHLLGIFFYASAESRERRAAKAVEEALKAARRKLTAPR